MRQLNTLVCAVIAGIFISSPAWAQSADNPDLHPILQQNAPAQVLSRDILALPVKERQAWLHAIVTGLAVGYVKVAPKTSRCLTDWAFEKGNGLELTSRYLKKYPDEPAYSVVFAVAKQACSEL